MRTFKLLAVALGTFFLLPQIAGANEVPSANINCERIVVQYVDFPQEPTPIEVIVKWKGQKYVLAGVKTTGISGVINVPLDLQGKGVAKLDLDWVVGTKHTFDSKTTLNCVNPETTTTTSPPIITTSDPTTTSTMTPLPPISTPKPNPGELPRTGATSDFLLILGVIAFGAGLAILVSNRPRDI